MSKPIRVWISAVVLGMVLAGGCASHDPTGHREQHQEAGDAVELERRAIERWIAHDFDGLTEIEGQLAAALRTGYSATMATTEGSATVVRTALIEWVGGVRRFSRERYQTILKPLRDDPDCAGSVIGDAALLEYVTAITAPEPAPAQVALSLRDLARQMVCLQQDQSADLAAAMRAAFEDTVATLRLDQLDGAVPYLVQAVAQPMLLVHEVERRHGENAALTAWFRTYKAALIDGARTRRTPMTWTGLWLYDRLTGRLRGLAAADEESSDAPQSENLVKLSAFYETLAKPERDDLKCSLIEMVERGTSEHRYHCAGSTCAAGEGDACEHPPDGGGELPDGDGPGAGGVAIPGMITDATVACITEQASHSPGRAQLTCLMETTGFRANPLTSVTKELAEVALPGVKPGGFCEIGHAADAQFDVDVQQAYDNYQTAVDAADSSLSWETDWLAWLQVLADDAYQDYQNNPTPANDMARQQANNDVDAQEEVVNKEMERAAAAKQAAADKLAKELEAARQKRDAGKNGGSGTGGGSGSGGGSASPGGGSGSAGSGAGGGSGDGGGSGSAADPGTGDQRCADDDCGCSAMSATVQAGLDCLTADAKPETFDPMTGPGGCGNDCDPIEPGVDGAGLTCTSTLIENEPAKLSAQCWRVQCAASDTASTCCGGGLSGGTPSGAGLPNPCLEAHCSDGAQPTVQGGMCVCGTSGTGLPGGAAFPPAGGPVNGGGYPW
jgi:hypothetical protein